MTEKNQHQAVTKCINHWADSANIKGVTFNNLCSGLTGKCFEMPNASYTNRWWQFRMTRQIQILILLCITISSCKQNSPKDLTLLTNEWTADSSTFWQVNNESDIELLKPKDTLNIDFITRKVFKRKIADNLELEKIILIDSKSGKTISESDLYKRKLGAFTESHVDISYDYEKEEYSAYIIDSTGTKNKIEENKREAENALKYANKNNLYLCGTAYIGILNEGIPKFPIMKEISKDSALSIIKTWTSK